LGQRVCPRALLQWLYNNGSKYPAVMEGLMAEALAAFPNESTEQVSYLKYITKMAKRYGRNWWPALVTRLGLRGSLTGASSPRARWLRYASHEYLSIGELAGGAYRDNYVLVILREDAPSHKLEVVGMVSPPEARRVIYALFTDDAHYSLLEPVRQYTPGQPIFHQAPAALQPELNAVYNQQQQHQAPRAASGKDGRRLSWQTSPVLVRAPSKSSLGDRSSASVPPAAPSPLGAAPPIVASGGDVLSRSSSTAAMGGGTAGGAIVGDASASTTPTSSTAPQSWTAKSTPTLLLGLVEWRRLLTCGRV